MSNNPKLSQSDQQQKEQTQQQSSNLKYDSGFEFYIPNQFIDYFKTIKTSSINQKKSDFYSYERYINVVQQIYSGQSQLSQKSENINHLLVKEKINQQQQKSNELKAKKAQILQQLSLLNDQVSRTKRQKSISKDKTNLSMDVSRISSKDNAEEVDGSVEKNNMKLILSKEQHRKLVTKLVKQREERDKNRVILNQKEQQKLKKSQQQHRMIQLTRIEEEKKKRSQQIQQKLKKKKQIHQKFLQGEKQSLKKVQQIKHRKFLYEQISEKFEFNVKMPLLQEQKKQLKQKRQFAKAYSIDQIRNHQKTYMELRQSSMKKSQAIETLKSPAQNYKAPIKSSRLEKILEEEKLQQRQKLMQKKRAVEQKLQRQDNYVEYLKQNFAKVKIDKSKEDEIKSRIEKSKVIKQQIDSRSIGIHYLQQAKKMRRKTAQQGNLTQRQESKDGQNQGNITVLSEQLKKQKLVSQSRIADEIRGNKLIKKRQQKIQTLINDASIDDKERVKKLKMETEKINEALMMKQEMLRYGYSEKIEDQAVELLLTSIQAKMGIIDISRDKEGIKG